MSFARSFRISAMMLALMSSRGTTSFCQSGSQPIYMDRSQPISRPGSGLLQSSHYRRRVQDLLGGITLKEKVGQLNLSCVYVDGLGKTIQEKMEACKRFAAGFSFQAARINEVFPCQHSAESVPPLFRW